MGVQFYNEFIPEYQRNYFDRKKGVNNNGHLSKKPVFLLWNFNYSKYTFRFTTLQIPFWETQQEKVCWIVQPSPLVNKASVATLVVIYNEESYTLEKTLKSLSLQLSNQKLDHDLLLVGDGLEQMSTSMGAYLQKLFYPQTIPMDEDCWPLNENTCIVNAHSDHNFWPHGR